MRIKKLICASKDSPPGQAFDSIFDVELNLFGYGDDENDQQLIQTNEIAYKLHFPHLDGKFLVDISRSTICPDSYSVKIQVSKPFNIWPFIGAIEFIRKDYIEYENTRIFYRQGEVPGSYGCYREGGRKLQVMNTFNITLSKFAPHETGHSTLIIKFTLSTDLLSRMSSPAAVPQQPIINEKLKIIESIRGKKFLREYNLGRMLKNEENFRDFTIMAGNLNIRVHKVVLAAQSKVFAQMLSTEMDESRNCSLKIPDIPQDSVKIAIDFMYSGEIEVKVDEKIGEVLRGLYIFAQKYDMDNLKWSVFEKCHNHIEYFQRNPGEKLQILQFVTLHETATDMNDLHSFLAIFGPYSVEL